MAGIVRQWLSGWRGVPIDLSSPLPLDVARSRLRAEVQSRWSPGGFDGRRVVGRLRDDDTMRLEARAPMIRNSWRPVARCDLGPAGAGCRVTGTLRAPAAVLAFSAVWLTLACLAGLLGLLSLLAALATGHWHEAGGPAVVAAAAAGFVLAGSALIGVGFAFGRRDGDFLLTWLAELLDTATPAGH